MRIIKAIALRLLPGLIIGAILIATIAAIPESKVQAAREAQHRTTGGGMDQ